MRIVQETYYAIELMEVLAKLPKGEIMNAKELTKDNKISLKFALKILRRLRKARIIDSFRGMSGGYIMAKKAVTVYDIVKVMQPDQMTLISEENYKCKKSNMTDTKKTLKKIDTTIQNELKKIKIIRGY